MRVLSLFSVVFLSVMLEAKTELPPSDVEKIGEAAYIYAYPLVTMDVTEKVLTNVETAGEFKAPVGQFANLRQYPTPAFKDVTTPNADTLYSSAWLDLSKEPWVLHVPNEYDRYYLLPMLNGWTDVIESVGTRTTGTSAKDFVITGPNWKGKLPDGLKEIKSSTDTLWIIGRTYCTGTPQDYKLVHAIQDGYSLTPLSSYGKTYSPPKGKVDPSVDMKTPVRDQVNSLSAEAFFNRFVTLLVSNPPSHEDQFLIDEIAKIGLVAQTSDKKLKFDEKTLQILEKAKESALKKIQAHASQAGKVINGWIYPKDTGNYGTDYLQRAYVAMAGLGANLPSDAIYPSRFTDSDETPLTGASQYTMHFEKGNQVPVRGFWSLTMYDQAMFFVENPLNRYNLSGRDKFKYNADGSLDLYIQAKSPGKDKESNWLPAPEGNFSLVFRLYWPEEQAISGTWKLPQVVKTK